MQQAHKKFEHLIATLNNADQMQLYSNVKYIKNEMIGNNTKKLLFMYLGLIPKLVAILDHQNTDLHLKIQTAICLGSFAYGNEALIESLVKAGSIRPLLECCLSQDLQLLEASCRALKGILQNPAVPREDIFRTKFIQRLIQLLSFQNHLSCLAASILARCCETRQHQEQIQEALPYLLEMFFKGNPKSQEAALDVFSSLCRENQKLSLLIFEHPNFLQHLIPFLHDINPSLKLIACTCLANMYRAQALPSNSTVLYTNLLPSLVQLLDEPQMSIKEKAPLVLAYLVADHEEMQKRAAEVDAINKMAQIFQKADNERLIESLLLALAALSSSQEDNRKRIIEAKILNTVVTCLEHSSVGVRAAACQLTRSLSRSVRQLRTGLVDAGVAQPLFNLLSDENLSVLTTVTATLCNIVLDFSPMKKIALESGGVAKLVALTDSPSTALRLNALWALKNLLYNADCEMKSVVMQNLGYPKLIQLMKDPEYGVQEQGVNLIRNLVCGQVEDIESVFNGLGENLFMEMILEKLSSQREEILVQAIYVVVNIATGNEKHKSVIMKHEPILQHIARYMSHPSSSIRVASIWCAINLTWPEEPGSLERIQILKNLGFEQKLQSLVNDEEMDVKERVKAALENFNQSNEPMNTPPNQRDAMQV